MRVEKGSSSEEIPTLGEILDGMEPGTTIRIPASLVTNPELRARLSEDPDAPRILDEKGNRIGTWARATFAGITEIPFYEVTRNIPDPTIPPADRREFEITHQGIETESDYPAVVVIPMRITPEGRPQFRPQRQSRLSLKPSIYSDHPNADVCFAQGKVKEGETMSEAAEREVLEETGLEVKEIIPLGTKYVNQSTSQWVYGIYIGIVDYKEVELEEETTLLQPDEFIHQLPWMYWDEIKDIDLDASDARISVAMRYLGNFLEHPERYPEVFEQITTL